MKVTLVLLSIFIVASFAASDRVFELVHLSSIGVDDSVLDNDVAEIPAYDPRSQRVFVTNNDAVRIDVFDIRNPSNPSLFTSIQLSNFGGGLQSVDIYDNVLAVAVAVSKKYVFFLLLLELIFFLLLKNRMIIHKMTVQLFLLV